MIEDLFVILGFCDTPSVLEIVKIVNMVINIIKIIIPIILIIVLIVELTRAVMNGDVEKIGKSVFNKALAAVLIFLIPTIVSLLVSLVAKNTEYKNCLVPVTSEEIAVAYNTRAEELVSIAEKTLDINDYNSASVYLTHVKDFDAKNGFLDRLAAVKEKIDEINRQKEEEIRRKNQKDVNNGDDGGAGDYPSQTFGHCSFERKTVDGIPYGICVPNNYNNQSIPMIVWLHGVGEVGSSFDTLSWSGLLGVVRGWSETGLKEIPAIIVAPHLMGGDWSNQGGNVKKIMDTVMNKYNINKRKVALIGHSLGGDGVVSVAAANQSYFSCLTILSSYTGSVPGGTSGYFSRIPIKGYCEYGEPEYYMDSFFSSIGRAGQVRKFSCSHGEVPRKALLLDENGDGRSDLIYWMLNQSK